MKKNYIAQLTIAATLLLVASSCSEPSAQALESPEVPVSVEPQFTQGAITRTSGDSWVEGDQIGVWMVEAETTQACNDQSNYPYVALSSSALSDFSPSDQTLYFPTDGATVDFVAYYPFQQGADSGIYSVDLSSGIASEVDLLRASATGHSQELSEVELQFAHRLSQFTLNIILGSGISTTASISAVVEGSVATASYDLLSDSFTLDSTVGDVPLNIDGLVATTILLPQTMGSDAQVVFTIEDAQYTWNIADELFTSGYDHQYNITIQKLGITVVDCTITNWSVVSGTAQAN